MTDVKKKKLTIKQEKFCQKYVELGNASEAYRQSYNAGKMATHVINNKASELLKVGGVRVRTEELQKHHQERHNVTVTSLTEEFEEARELAIKCNSPSAMVSSTLGKAKIHGLLRDDKTITIKSVHDMTEGELLEFLGGEPTDEELRKAIGDEKVGEAS